MGSKAHQIISHNYIKIIGMKKMKTPRALYFINQFTPGHQYCIYNHKEKISFNEHPKINQI